MHTRLFFFFFLCLLFSCNDSKRAEPTSAIEVGSAFIRASLDGDFKEASRFLLNEKQNLELFSSYENYYQRLPADIRNKYKSSSYKVNEYSELNDTTAILNYSNDFMKQPMELKVVRKNEAWKIDFRHTPDMELRP